MYKQFLLFALILCSIVSGRQGMVGAYEPGNIQELQKSPTFIQAESLARQSFQTANGVSLEDLVQVSQQIVSGVNYKMIFNSSKGLQKIVVYCQPWTNTYQLTSMEPAQ